LIRFESVTMAVMRWVPTERLDLVIEPPRPISPSRLEIQWMAAVRLPSTALSAVP
jgi:hypothetical protein